MMPPRGGAGTASCALCEVEVGAVTRNGCAPRPAADEAVVRPEAACTDPDPRCLDVLRRQYVLEHFHALLHRPEIIGLFERMFGEPVLKHPECLIRVIFPKQYNFENTSGPRSDNLRPAASIR